MALPGTIAGVPRLVPSGGWTIADMDSELFLNVRREGARTVFKLGQHAELYFPDWTAANAYANVIRGPALISGLQAVFAEHPRYIIDASLRVFGTIRGHAGHPDVRRSCVFVGFDTDGGGLRARFTYPSMYTLEPGSFLSADLFSDRSSADAIARLIKSMPSSAICLFREDDVNNFHCAGVASIHARTIAPAQRFHKSTHSATPVIPAITEGDYTLPVRNFRHISLATDEEVRSATKK